MEKLKATIEIIGINPYVLLPGQVLEKIFKQAGKGRGPIPIKGIINHKAYTQTLVKYKGIWRLYINTKMLENSPKRIGEIIEISVDFDPTDRTIELHPKLEKALKQNEGAGIVFENLTPSLKHEIKRYLSRLKSEESIDFNVLKAIDFLLGKGKFVGREKPVLKKQRPH